MIDQAVFDRIKLLASGRVHYVQAPQKPTFPYLVYNVISGVGEYSDDGYDGLSEHRVQIDVWATTREEKVSLYEEVKNLMRPSSTDFDTTGENELPNDIDSEVNDHHAGIEFFCWRKSTEGEAP